MADVAPKQKESEAGAGWIMTFADLMSLLMCFFVLLLSFAELDVMKFKAIAGSMKLAFGVQREIRAVEIPKGTSIIAQQFSPGTPDQTLIDEIRQQTIDEDKQSLEFTDALVDEKEGTDPEQKDTGSDAQEKETAQDAERLKEALRAEIDKGMIEIVSEGAMIIIRIREKGSFPSGSAKFDPAFESVALKLRTTLQDIDGTIAVAGHTDNIPIRTSLYRSNWDLSSARAVSVVHTLLEGGELDAGRFVAEGHGEAHPLTDNETAEGRALNRRVEITIRQVAEVRPATPVDDNEAVDDASIAGAQLPLPPVLPDDAPAGPLTDGAPPPVVTAEAGDAAVLPSAPAAERPPAATPVTPAPPPVTQAQPPVVNPVAGVPATVARRPAAAAVFPGRPASGPPSRIDRIREGMEQSR